MKNMVYNVPTKENFEFSSIPSIIVGKDEVPLRNTIRSYYIGISWLFWGIYYYYK